MEWLALLLSSSILIISFIVLLIKNYQASLLAYVGLFLYAYLTEFKILGTGILILFLALTLMTMIIHHNWSNIRSHTWLRIQTVASGISGAIIGYLIMGPWLALGGYLFLGLLVQQNKAGLALLLEFLLIFIMVSTFFLHVT